MSCSYHKGQGRQEIQNHIVIAKQKRHLKYFLHVDRSWLQVCTLAEMQSDVRPSSSYCWLSMKPRSAPRSDVRYVLIDNKIVLTLPQSLQFMLVAYVKKNGVHLKDVLVAVQICAHVKQCLGKAPDWSLVFQLKQEEVEISTVHASDAIVTWEFIKISTCQEMGIDTSALPRNCVFIPRYSIGDDVWKFHSAEVALAACPSHLVCKVM